MALVADRPFLWPTMGHQRGPSSLRGPAAATFDSVTDRLATTMQAMEAGAINKFNFFIPTLTTGTTLEVRIETLGADGRPSGTLWGTNTNGTVAVSSIGAKTVTFTANATVAAADFFAVVIKYSSGAVPNFTFSYTNLNFTDIWGNFPGLYQDTGTGTYTPLHPALLHGCLEYSGIGPVFNPAFIPLTDASSAGVGYNSATNPDEHAFRFQVPTRRRTIGGIITLDAIAAGADFRIQLWDAVGNLESNAVAQLFVDGDIAWGLTARGSCWFTFVSPAILEPNVPYYLGMRAQTANNIAVGQYTLMSVTNVLQAMPSGVECYLATRNWTAIDPGTVGAWTLDTTSVPIVSLIIDQVESGGARRALWY